MASKVFISHVAEDKELVDDFCELLEDGMGIHDIFCSSKNGCLGIGEDFIRRIREEVCGCEVVIFLITQKYLKSPFCQIEMGAAWALGKQIKPIVVQPLTFKDLNKPMDDHQAISLTDEDGLDQLFRELLKQGIATAGALHFVNALKKFKLNCGILEADSKGIYRAIVTEIYKRPGEDVYFYKLKGKILEPDLVKHKVGNHFECWEKEQQWISARYEKVEGLREGDVLAFKLAGGDFKEELRHGSQILQNVRNLYYRNPHIVK